MIEKTKEEQEEEEEENDRKEEKEKDENGREISARNTIIASFIDFLLFFCRPAIRVAQNAMSIAEPCKPSRQAAPQRQAPARAPAHAPGPPPGRLPRRNRAAASRGSAAASAASGPRRPRAPLHRAPPAVPRRAPWRARPRTCMRARAPARAPRPAQPLTGPPSSAHKKRLPQLRATLRRQGAARAGRTRGAGQPQPGQRHARACRALPGRPPPPTPAARTHLTQLLASANKRRRI